MALLVGILITGVLAVSIVPFIIFMPTYLIKINFNKYFVPAIYANALYIASIIIMPYLNKNKTHK